MRLFFAIMLPEAVRAQVEQAQAGLRAVIGDDGIRWTPTEKLHYTLKFLGGTAGQDLPAAVAAARAAAAGSVPFTFTPGGIGAFPTPRRPQVLWIGIERHQQQAEEAQALQLLAERLDAALVECGFAPEERAFRPHLTLARIKSRSGEAAAAKALPPLIASVQKTVRLSPIHVAEFALVESELRPDRSVYTVLETFSLSSVPGFD